MIELSNRLNTIASLVPYSDDIADVGTDHGYLAVWLLQNQRAKHVFATDIHAGPLARAKQTASEHDMLDGMTFHLCDGLQFPDAEKSGAVILAGMGGETILSILQAAPWTWENTDLILQPQSKQPVLFSWLREHGIGLCSAMLCRDAGKLYFAVRARGGTDTASSLEDLLLKSHDPLLPQYLGAEIKRIERALAGISHANRETSELKAELKERKNYLESYRKEALTW